MVFECYDCSGIDGFEKGLAVAASFIILLMGRTKKNQELTGQVGLAMLFFLWSIYNDVGKCIITLMLSKMGRIESVKHTLGAYSKSSVTK